MRDLYLSHRFFYLFGGLILLFVAGFPLPPLFPLAQAALVLVLALIGLDAWLLFREDKLVEATRHLPKVFSLGDQNAVRINLRNPTAQPLRLTIIDELPVQFQIRDFERQLYLSPQSESDIQYQLRPLERGAYDFGHINLFASTRLGFLQRRFRAGNTAEVPVYPSIAQMKRYELRAFDRTSQPKGLKKIRRIGHSYEFEQIKNYVRGDDYRSINWKASSRKATLMVNQYEDERAQQVYNIIDKSRSMKMPFEGLSLMDYAINTSLVISNIALQKYDRAGLITFSDKIGATIKADSKPTQLNKIIQALYQEKERPLEANYELLFYGARKLIRGRSLLLLYSNFESMYALERVLPILRRINNAHLLVVIFFENTEIRDYSEAEVDSLEEIYYQTVAQQFLNEKARMVQKLQQFGIQAVLTRPEDLSINTINKYLELKSRGLI